MDEDNVVADNSNTAEEVAPEATETIEEVKARLAKAEELANNYKIRAEKAEKKPKEEAPKQQDGLTNKDVLFLAKSDVHEEDMDELVEYAKFKKLPLADAYKQYKGVLDVKAEERRTAMAANTKGGARGSSKVSGEDLLHRAETTGEVPTSDEGMRNLFIARRAKKVGK